MCVVLDLIDDGLLSSFGIIKKILHIISDGQICHTCLQLSSTGFDSNVGAYEIENWNEWNYVTIEGLLNPFLVIKAIFSNGNNYDSLKCIL